MKKIKYILLLNFMIFCVFLVGCDNINIIFSNNKNENNTEKYQIIDNVIISETPIMGSRAVEHFENVNDLKDYYENNKLLTSNYFFINIDDICLGYEDNLLNNYVIISEENKEDIANPIGYVSCDVYDEKLSNDNSLNKSYRMKAYFYLQEEQQEVNLYYELYKFENEKLMWNNVLYVYNNEDIVIKLFYYTKIEINIEYFINMIEENIFVLSKDEDIK